MKAMEVVEDASGLREQANPRKKTPPGGKGCKYNFISRLIYKWSYIFCSKPVRSTILLLLAVALLA